MWPKDEFLPLLLPHKVNQPIIEFLHEKAPQGSLDLVYELLVAAEGLNDTLIYTPDDNGEAYAALYTYNTVIYALALGTGLLAFRIPGHSEHVFSPLGANWTWYAMWEQHSSLAARRIEVRGLCRMAYKMALRL